MLLLALETSSSRGGLALYDQSELRASLDLPRGLVHGREVTVYLDRLMEGLGLVPSDLEVIAVSAGPGSYTGIRVGVTVAKSLGYALNCGVLPVSSLEVLAMNGLEEPDDGDATLCPVLDGKQGHLYRGVYRLAGDPARPLLEILLEAGVEQLENLDGGTFPGVPPGARLFGDGAELALTRLGESAGLEQGPESWNWPRATRLGELALARLTHGEAPVRGEAVHALSPVYMRVSEAERKFDLSREEPGGADQN